MHSAQYDENKENNTPPISNPLEHVNPNDSLYSRVTDASAAGINCILYLLRLYLSFTVFTFLLTYILISLQMQREEIQR